MYNNLRGEWASADNSLPLIRETCMYNVTISVTQFYEI